MRGNEIKLPFIQSIDQAIPVLFFPLGDIGEKCQTVIQQFCREVSEIESREVPSLVNSCSKFKITPPNILRIYPIFSNTLTQFQTLINTIQDHPYSFSLIYFCSVAIIDYSILSDLPDNPSDLLSSIPELNSIQFPSPINILIFNAPPSMVDVHSDTTGLIFNTQKNEVAFSVLSEFLSPHVASCAAQILDTVPSSVTVTGLAETNNGQIENQEVDKLKQNQNISEQKPIKTISGPPQLIARKALSDFAIVSKNYSECIRQSMNAIEKPNIPPLFLASFFETLASAEYLSNTDLKLKSFVSSDFRSSFERAFAASETPKIMFSSLSETSSFSLCCAYYCFAKNYLCAVDIALFTFLTKKLSSAFEIAYTLITKHSNEDRIFDRAMVLLEILRVFRMNHRETFVASKIGQIYQVPELNYRAAQLLADAATPESFITISTLCVPLLEPLQKTFGNAAIIPIAIKLLSSVGSILPPETQMQLFESIFDISTPPKTAFNPLKNLESERKLTLPLKIDKMEIKSNGSNLQKISENIKNSVFLYSYIQRGSKELLLPADCRNSILVSISNPFSFEINIRASLFVEFQENEEEKQNDSENAQKKKVKLQKREILLKANSTTNFGLQFMAETGVILVKGIKFTLFNPKNNHTNEFYKQKIEIENPIHVEMIKNAPMLRMRTDLSLIPMTLYEGERFSFTIWVLNSGKSTLSKVELNFGNFKNIEVLNINPDSKSTRKSLRPGEEFPFKCVVIATIEDPPLEITALGDVSSNYIATAKLTQIFNILPSLRVSRIFMIKNTLDHKINHPPLHLSSIFTPNDLNLDNFYSISDQSFMNKTISLKEIQPKKSILSPESDQILNNSLPRKLFESVISKGTTNDTEIICIGYEISNLSDCSVFYRSSIKNEVSEGLIGHGEGILLIGEYKISEIKSDGSNAPKMRVHAIIKKREDELERGLSLEERQKIARSVGVIMNLEENWHFEWAVSLQRKGFLKLEGVGLEEKLYQKIFSEKPKIQVVFKNDCGEISDSNPAKEGDEIILQILYEFPKIAIKNISELKNSEKNEIQKAKCKLILPDSLIKIGAIMWEGNLIQEKEGNQGEFKYPLFLGERGDIEMRIECQNDNFDEIRTVILSVK